MTDYARFVRRRRTEAAASGAQRVGLNTWLLLCIALAHVRHAHAARAACLVGHFDETYARVGRVAAPQEERARTEIRTTAIAARSAAEFDRYTALGGTLNEERAITIAFCHDRRVFEPGTPSPNAAPSAAGS